ncbi:MAG: FKBP-type peptidyl-prolyl cis-trans isomerase [Lachnospiraceae bacterium]|nr:FKBP-type peptidyl-prolyl cis-trans isomerase [Lachnospiraceae bacterium]
MRRHMITTALLLSAVMIFSGCGNSASNKTNKGAAEATTAVSYQETEITMDAAKYIQLGKYKGLTINGISTEVTDKDVMNEIQYTIDQATSYEEVTDHDTIKKGDYVNVDYTTTVDGKVDDLDSDADVDLKIGGGEYVLGKNFDMETPLIGAKKGETKTLQLTFPKNYQDNEKVAGKDCIVKVTINKIEKEVKPELTDDFVKKNTEYSSVEEYKSQVRKELEETKDSDGEYYNNTALMKKVVANCKQKEPFPADLVKKAEYNIKAELTVEAESYDTTVKELIKEYYPEGLEAGAKQMLKQQCVEDLLAEKMNIEVTEEDYQKEIQDAIKKDGYSSEKEILKDTPKKAIYDYIRSDKVWTTLMKDTKIHVIADNADEAYELEEMGPNAQPYEADQETSTEK